MRSMISPLGSGSFEGVPPAFAAASKPWPGATPCGPELWCRTARDIVAAVMEVGEEEMLCPQRSRAPICHARHVAIYLAHVIFQVSLTDISHAFGRDRTSVAHAVRRIEDQRDGEAFDRMLTRLERLAHSCRLLTQPQTPGERERCSS